MNLAAEPGPPRRGTKAFLAASGVAQLCALARYTVLARLLGPEQLGLAAILILTAQFFESVTDSGSDRFLVQDRGGNDPALLRLTHPVSLARWSFWLDPWRAFQVRRNWRRKSRYWRLRR